ncbi:hypothetical protein C5615_38650 [Burkholderia cepacia]|uniref:Carbonic anhydrase n=1 Tax=Burkholderia cepacia TaxID=292 RepID=A0A2S8HUK3_BURCE|nr:carbonic anhydrase [Burkholderia cepacia]PQP06075.1 hypothetical protein C5615_38650 [Burkholderia cepacia]
MWRIFNESRPSLKLGSNRASDRDALLDAAVTENVLRVVNRLRKSEMLLTEPLKAKKLQIVGARYGLDDGRVTFFNE